MKKILVTGGAGFIGSHVVHALQEKYPEAFILVVDDLSIGDWRNLAGFKGDFVCRDIWDTECRQLLAGAQFDAVLHFAANSDTRDEYSEVALENIEGFRAAIAISNRNKCPFIYASSAAVYGHRNEIMKETDPMTPANIYGFSKAQNDNIASSFIKVDKSWPIMGIRFFNVYGPGEAHKGSFSSMIYQMYCSALKVEAPCLFKDGEQKRDFIYIKDVVDLVMLCLEKKKAGIYNCGSGGAKSFLTVYDTLKSHLGIPEGSPQFIECPYKFFQSFTQADISLAKEAFGWEPKYSLYAGIAEYIRFLKLAKKD
jgi:ADP-L-glycero-D-manno-heptose 6-epimerase